MFSITSFQNPRIKQLLALHKGSERRRQELYLIEGLREVQRFWQACQSMHATPVGQEGFLELYIKSSCLKNQAIQSLVQIAGLSREIIELPDRLFDKISLRESPDGILGVAKQHMLTWADISRATPLRVLIAESVEKPGNLGALLRTADGVGASALILCEQSVEIWNPSVIRASMGCFFHIPTLVMSSQACQDLMIQESIQMVAASPESSLLYTQVTYGPRVALVVGSEDHGLSSIWNKPSIQHVRLPMLGQADSLNVVVAAGVCLYEILRSHERH